MERETRLTRAKPHLGRIEQWAKLPALGHGLGYRIAGIAVDHPDFFTDRDVLTSYVVAHDEKTGEIETRNSRYTLVGRAVA